MHPSPPSLPSASREAGNAALVRGDPSEAARLYSLALSGSPSDAKLLSNRSLAYYRLNRFDLALQDAVAAVRLEPWWEKGHIRRALALEKLGCEVEDLLACYEEACEVVHPRSEQIMAAAQGLREQVVQKRLQEAQKSREAAGIEAREAPAEHAEQGEAQRISWNEDSLALHEAERGVLYGRMKIDHPDTPFLVYDEEMAEKHNLIGTVKDKDSKPEFVDIALLQQQLGILHLQQERGENIVGDKGAPLFEQKRRQFYRNEGQALVASEDANAAEETAAEQNSC